MIDAEHIFEEEVKARREQGILNWGKKSEKKMKSIRRNLQKYRPNSDCIRSSSI